MSEQDNETALNTAFAAWLTQVKRLIHDEAVHVTHAVNSLKVGGYSINDLVLKMRGEVQVHEQDHTNPHSDTLAALGGMTQASFNAQAMLYFPKDSIPLTKVPLLSATVSGSTVNIAAGTLNYRGRNVPIPAVSLTPSAAARQYVLLTMSGSAPNWSAALSLSNAQTESEVMMIVGNLNLVNNVPAVTMESLIRIGSKAVRSTPRGRSIPSSTGTQAGAGSLPTGWTS